MATVIDALIVTLGLDGKGFLSGSDKAKKAMKDTSGETDRMAKNMEARGKQAAAAFGAIRNQALALLAVFTAGVGIKNFTVNTVTSAASLGRLSDNIGISTEKLYAYQRANVMAGGSIEGMTAQIEESAKSVAAAKLGMMDDSTRMAFFFGIKQGDLKDAETFLKARSDIVARTYKTDPNKARFMAGQMGISDDTFNLIKLGASGMKAEVAAAQRRAKFSTQDAVNAESLRKKFFELNETVSFTSSKVLFALVPAFDKVADQFQAVADWIVLHKDDIAKWIGDAIVWVENFAKSLNKGAESLGGWKNILVALAGLKILSMITPLLSLAGALMSIGKALGLINAGSGAVAVLATAAGAAVIGGVAAATYSPSLNKGEDATLDAMRNAPTGPAQDKAVYAIEKLQGMGWDKDHAIGIVANLQAESSMDHTIVGDKGKAYGLAQWHPDRQEMFKKQFGMDIRKATFDQQLEFIDWELNNTEKPAGNAIRRATNSQTAAKEVQIRYERPAPENRDRDLAIRQGNAAVLYAVMEARPNVANGPVLPLNADNQVNNNYFTRKDGDVNNVSSVSNAPVSNVVNAVNMTSRATDPGHGQPNQSTSTSTSETNINGPISIVTQATDAKGIQDALQRSLGKLTLASQANTGLQ